MIQNMRLRIVSLSTCILLCAIGLSAASTHGKKVHLHGTLIDMTCWNARTGDTAKLLREHSKPCLQMPDCIHSGYAIVTPEGQVYRMNAASNEAQPNGSPQHRTTPTGASM